MKKFDELLKLTDEEKLEYLKQEEEKLIQSAPKSSVMRLRALQAKCNGVRHKYRNDIARLGAFRFMLYESLEELKNVLNGINKK